MTAIVALPIFATSVAAALQSAIKGTNTLKKNPENLLMTSNCLCFQTTEHDLFSHKETAI